MILWASVIAGKKNQSCKNWNCFISHCISIDWNVLKPLLPKRRFPYPFLRQLPQKMLLKKQLSIDEINNDFIFRFLLIFVKNIIDELYEIFVDIWLWPHFLRRDFPLYLFFRVKKILNQFSRTRFFTGFEIPALFSAAT